MKTTNPVLSRQSEWAFGTIPMHWRAAPLKHLCKRFSLYGANIAAEDYQLEGVRFIRTSDIREDGTLEDGGVFLPAQFVTDYILAEGDFLISRSGTVGRAYVYRAAHGMCAYAGYLVRYVLRDLETPRWLFYITKSPGFQQWLGASAIEATIGNVNGEKYANLLVPIPPVFEQRAITDFLDQETARLDGLVAAKERVLGLLAEKRRALITQAVTRGLNPRVPFHNSDIPWLGKIPAHWQILQLKFVTRSLQTGPFGSQLHAEEYITGGVPVVNPSHLNSGRICADDRVSVDEATAERLVIHRLSPCDVVFARRGELGRCGVVEPSQAGWLCGTGSLRARLRLDMVDPYYLVLVFTVTRVSDVLTFESVGSTMDNLNTEILGSCQFGVPPLTEQRAIVSYIAAETTKLDALRSATERTITLLKERRAALIAAAVTGKLDVQGAGRHIAVVAD